jgi:hypothetical protein
MNMRCLPLAFILCSGSTYGQTTVSGAASTRGACSPANTGNGNIFNITCGIGKEQGNQLLAIMNRVIANQIDPTAVLTKLDEIQKDMERLNNQPPATNNCPNGICVSGGVVDHPTVNNTVNSFQPIPPRITWTKTTVEGGSKQGPSEGPDSGHPGVKLSITVAGRFQFPMFAVRCNRACVATDIGVEGASSPKLYTTSRPDIAVAGFGGIPAQVEAGTVVWVTVRSKDASNIDVLEVSTYVPPQ